MDRDALFDKRDRVLVAGKQRWDKREVSDLTEIQTFEKRQVSSYGHSEHLSKDLFLQVLRDERYDYLFSDALSMWLGRAAQNQYEEADCEWLLRVAGSYVAETD